MRAIALHRSRHAACPGDRHARPRPRPRTRCSCACTRPRSTRSTTRLPPGYLLGMASSTSSPSPLAATTPASSNRSAPTSPPTPPAIEVYGFVLHANPAVHDGSWAELVTRLRAHLDRARARRRRPPNRRRRSAGRHHRRSRPSTCSNSPNADVLLVVGATGGVGSLAVRLAARAGATVIAPGLPEDEEYLRALGVREIVPRDGEIAELVRERHPDGVDALLDLVSYAPGAFDERAPARRPRRLIQRRRRRRPRPHQRDGRTDP